MWAIRNFTSYKVASGWGRDQDGVHEWIVAVKGTFAIDAAGRASIADAQVEPLQLPEYTGEPGASSLRYDADLVARKPTTDIVVNGTAYAPGLRLTREFGISMAVGPVRKQLRVVGHGSAGGGRASPKVEPLDRVPLAYERAWGGHDDADQDATRHRLDTRNPVGCGLFPPAGPAEPRWPNFEYLDGNPKNRGPAGFGPIDSHWSPRRELAGTYDDAWRQTRHPLLPSDWQPRSRQCAPTDQCPEHHLIGGEPVELRNLTPDGLWRFALPKVALGFQTRFAVPGGWRIREHTGRLSTVVLEPDLQRVLMVWVATLKCPGEIDYLEDTTVCELPY